MGGRYSARVDLQLSLDINAILQNAEPDVGISSAYWEDYEIETVELDGKNLFDTLDPEIRDQIHRALLQAIPSSWLDEALDEGNG